MHAELNVRFEQSIDDNKTILMATLTEFVTDQNVESGLFEAIDDNMYLQDKNIKISKN